MLGLVLPILEKKNQKGEDYSLAKLMINDDKNIHGEIRKIIKVCSN